MANWWDAAPVVEEPQERDWWDDAPVVQPSPPNLPPPSADRNSLMGRVDSGVRGFADFLSAGFADEIAAGLGTGFGFLGDYDQALADQRAIDAADHEDRFGYRLGGQIIGGLAGAAGLARAGLSPTVNAIQGGQSLVRVGGASAREGAALGAAHGFGSGQGLEDRSTGAVMGGAIGGTVGAAAPYAISGISNAVRRSLAPFAASPERAAAARMLQSEGVPLTAGQRTGSQGLRYAESEIGGQRAATIAEEQGRAFTDAAMRRAGGSGLADGDNMRALNQRLSQQFDDISARNTLQFDEQYARDILETAAEYDRVLPSEQRQLLGNIFTDIGDRFAANGGTLPGRDYQTIRSRLTNRANNARGSDNELASAYRGIRDALDNAMDRSVQPSDAGAWSQLRRQWGNMRTLERAAVGGGEEAALGVISPARLRMAASSGNPSAYARNQNDFAELARAGQAVMTPLPNSGTASRLAVRGLMSAPAAAGAIAGGASGDVLTGLLGAAAGAAVPRMVGSAMMSRPGQALLGNQVFAGPMSDNSRAIANLLLNSASAAHEGRNRTIEQLLISP